MKTIIIKNYLIWLSKTVWVVILVQCHLLKHIRITSFIYYTVRYVYNQEMWSYKKITNLFGKNILLMYYWIISWLNKNEFEWARIVPELIYCVQMFCKTCLLIKKIDIKKYHGKKTHHGLDIIWMSPNCNVVTTLIW